MGEKDNALFDLRVRRVIRKCVFVSLPIWGPVLGMIGWWASGIDTGLKANTTYLAKLGTQLEFVIEYIQEKK